MSIPFTQYLRPNGRPRNESINRPTEVEAIAHAFIAANGRYECEVLTTGQICLSAVKKIGRNDRIVASIVCSNDANIPANVDKLVNQANANANAAAKSTKGQHPADANSCAENKS